MASSDTGFEHFGTKIFSTTSQNYLEGEGLNLLSINEQEWIFFAP